MDELIWPGDWLRGVLAMCVLAVIAECGPAGTYGYAIAQRLAEQGLGRIKGGTLYPVLNRLEAEGHVHASWLPGEGGPGRKAFTLTPAGRRHLAERREQWSAFTQRTHDLIEKGSRT